MTDDEDLARQILTSAAGDLPHHDVVPHVLRAVIRRRRRRVLALGTAVCLLLAVSAAGTRQLLQSSPAPAAPATLGVTPAPTPTDRSPDTASPGDVARPSALPRPSAGTAVGLITLTRYDAHLDPYGSVAVSGNEAYWFAGETQVNGTYLTGRVVGQPLDGGPTVTREMSGQAAALAVAGSQLWIASSQGLLRLDPVTLSVRQRYQLSNAQSLAVTTAGLWVSYAAGLRLLDPATGATRSEVNDVAATSLTAPPDGEVFYDLEGGTGNHDVVQRSPAGVVLHRSATVDPSLGFYQPRADATGVWVTQPTGSLGGLLHLTRASLDLDGRTVGVASNGVQAYPAADGATYAEDAGQGLSCLTAGPSRNYLTLAPPTSGVAVNGADALIIGSGLLRQVSPPSACQPTNPLTAPQVSSPAHRPCTPGDLQQQQPVVGGAEGQQFTIFDVRNRSAAACGLSNHTAHVTGTDPAGLPQVLPLTIHLQQPDLLILNPGAVATIAMTAPDACNGGEAQRSYTDVTITIGSAGTFAVTPAHTKIIDCGNNMLHAWALGSQPGM